MTNFTGWNRRVWLTGSACRAALVCVAMVAVMSCLAANGGCALAQLPAGMIQSYKSKSTREVPPEYVGLKGKRTAVVVSADASILYERPEVAGELMRRVTQRLVEDGQIREYVDPSMVEARLYQTPGWAGMNKGELAKLLQGAERILWIELQEYRLRDKGNPYVLAGRAMGYVSVFETDGVSADTAAVTRSLKVFFPDMEAAGAADLNESFINNVIMYRLVNRATWPFITGDQPYMFKSGE